MWPIIVSDGSRPSRKKFPITSSIRLRKTGKRCNSFTRQRWLIWRKDLKIRGLNKIIHRMQYGDLIYTTLINSSYMNLAHWILGSNNRAICLRMRTSKGTYKKLIKLTTAHFITREVPHDYRIFDKKTFRRKRRCIHLLLAQIMQI